MNVSYQDFLSQKAYCFESHGVDVADSQLPQPLYEFQARLTKWTLKKGRSALWADTGLGKTFMQVSWAHHVPGPVLIAAPLCVSRQTIEEAKKIDIAISAKFGEEKIQIINYEKLHHVDPANYAGVVLDEFHPEIGRWLYAHKAN